MLDASGFAGTIVIARRGATDAGSRPGTATPKGRKDVVAGFVQPTARRAEVVALGCGGPGEAVGRARPRVDRSGCGERSPGGPS
jgi:hypothetical protein